jgi:hypothetical protein
MPVPVPLKQQSLGQRPPYQPPMWEISKYSSTASSSPDSSISPCSTSASLPASWVPLGPWLLASRQPSISGGRGHHSTTRTRIACPNARKFLCHAGLVCIKTGGCDSDGFLLLAFLNLRLLTPHSRQNTFITSVVASGRFLSRLASRQRWRR